MYNIDIQSPEFVKCLERGEREAFQRLFEMYHKALCFFATRIVRDSLEAEDTDAAHYYTEKFLLFSN